MFWSNIRDSAPEAGSAAILILYMFLTMNACMMINFLHSLRPAGPARKASERAETRHHTGALESTFTHDSDEMNPEVQRQRSRQEMPPAGQRITIHEWAA
jgi:hypothetical protein